jgi:heterodisulfide reductase subunit A-like polyferredoxin
MYNNVEDIVNNGLCIGCMACISMCIFGELNVEDGDFGYPVPKKHKDCTNCGNCLLECPSSSSDGNND